MNDAVKTLDKEKAPGPDGILAEFILKLDFNAAVVFKFVLLNGIPSIWRKAFIIPILEKAKPSNELKSYRPIALTSILCKLYEKMVMARLTNHLRENRIIDPAQGAFQMHKSSIDQAAFLCQTIHDNMNNHLVTLATFVDFRAAYDLVSRDILIQKLIKTNVPGGLIHTIRNFLCQRFISARFHDRTSSFKQVRRGLLQGAVSSTTLFNCMINYLCPLLLTIPGVDVILFADDLAILVAGENMETIEESMNSALAVLQQWFCYRSKTDVQIPCSRPS